MDLISLSLDGPLAPKDQQALHQHLEQCPQCRQLSHELSDIHTELQNLEEQEVPDDLAQGVMDQIRALDHSPKIIPLWKRPHWKALGSIAACALICVGIWQAGSGSKDTALMENFSPAAAQGTAEYAPAPAALEPEVETVLQDAPTAPQLKLTPAAPESMAESAENGTASFALDNSSIAAIPNDETLMEWAVEALGETPGTLLLLSQLPAELESCGTWYQDSDGHSFFQFDLIPDETTHPVLFDAAVYCVRREDTPLVIMLWDN